MPLLKLYDIVRPVSIERNSHAYDINLNEHLVIRIKIIKF